MDRLAMAEREVRAALVHWESIPRPLSAHLEDRIALGEAMLAADPTNGVIRQALAQLGRRRLTETDDGVFTLAEAAFDRANEWYRALVLEDQIKKGVTNG